jgi:hypothetical protein
MRAPGNRRDHPSGAYSTTHGGAKSFCGGLFTQEFEVELCHGGIEALNALGVISDGSRHRREEIE